MDTGSWFSIYLKNSFLAACCLFFLIQAIPLLFAANFNETAKSFQLKSALLFIPLAICCSTYINGAVWQKLMNYYIGILSLTLFYCLLLAFYKFFFLKAQSTVFFYHELVVPFRQHAIQVSVYLFCGLVYLLGKIKNGIYLINRSVHFLMILYFTCCILLLSSKLVIAFTVGCFVFYFIAFIKQMPGSSFLQLCLQGSQ
jgi:hypothetical protein